jgi:acyl-coenzyme A synthetase/AMP-(fatty) acid ligase
LIETDGVLWFPRDVEEAFCAIDGVAQAALIGVADAAHGQRPYAFITASPGAILDADRLKSAIVGKVGYDLAPLIVNVVADLPMTPTGKIAKGELAARLQNAA